MKFTIIGHTKDDSYYDRCSGSIEQVPGKFVVLYFINEQEFIQVWAHATFHDTYETLVVLLDGVPEQHMSPDELETLYRLGDKRLEYTPIIKAAHEEAECIRKDAERKVAEERAKVFAAQERARDLAALEKLQKKLGLN